MNLQLSGKLALVSGSTAGIGYAIARTLAEEGATVIVNGRQHDKDWRRFFDVNVLSGVRLARLVLPAMKRANWGRIISISSTWHGQAARASSRSRRSSSTACAPPR